MECTIVKFDTCGTLSDIIRYIFVQPHGGDVAQAAATADARACPRLHWAGEQGDAAFAQTR